MDRSEGKTGAGSRAVRMRPPTRSRKGAANLILIAWRALLALADALILAVPAIDDRLTAGFGLAYLAVLLSSLAGLAIALTVPVLTARR